MKRITTREVLVPDDLTRQVLEDVARWTRTGVLPAVRPCCGQDYCICEDAPAPDSLRSYARDTAAFDRAANTTRLRVLTMPQHHEPAPPQCTTDPMVCDCPIHQAERVQSIKRGSRDTRQPWAAAERAA